MTPTSRRFVLLLGVVLISVSLLGVSLGSDPQPEASVVQAPTTQTAPYAYTAWVKLNDMVPMEADAGDLYVRLIVVDGAVPLAPYSRE